jgi:hypothetical protein
MTGGTFAVIARTAKRDVAIQNEVSALLDCFVATLLAMTGGK